jgi:hypothetical protein
MGLQFGLILHKTETTARRWFVVSGRMLFWRFLMGYLRLGMLVLGLMPFRQTFLAGLFDALAVTMRFYPSGIYLLPALVAGLTHLVLTYEKNRPSAELS